MAVQQSSPHLDLGGRAVLLDEVDPRAFVPVDAAGPSTEVVDDAIRCGRAVVIGGDAELARAAGTAIVTRLGTDAVGRVVVEAPVVSPGWVRDLTAAGLVAGLVLSPPETAGAEIGLLTQGLTAGVRTVRGAHPVRFRRVRAVVEALAAAAEAGEASS